MRIGGKKPSNLFLHLIAIVIALTTLLPLVWIFSLSLKSVQEVYLLPPSLIPHKPVLDNYRYVLNALHGFGQEAGASRLLTLYRNSVVVTLSTVVIVTIIASLAGYALARFKFRGREIIFLLFFALTVFPIGSTRMAQIELMRWLHLRNSLTGLILLYSTGFGIPLFFMRQVFLNIPSELEDSARIDGASDFRIWLHIMMPLATGGLGLAVVITFIKAWGDAGIAYSMIDKAEKMTLAWGIAQVMPYGGDGAAKVSGLGLGATWITFYVMPTILIFVALQKLFIRGALEGLKL